MPKYAFLGGYTSESWARMIQNPEDRATAVRKLAESVGGKLESFFWSFGEDDFLVIADAPDDVTATAISVAVAGSGTLRNLRTVKLITTEEARKVLEKAKTAQRAYTPPGGVEAGVRR